MSFRPLSALMTIACSLLFANAMAATAPLTISEDELASVILAPSALNIAPRVFNRVDILSLSGASLEYSWAEFVGDTLRLHDILLDDNNYWADFRFDGTQFFQLVQTGAGRGESITRPEIPGVDSSKAMSSMRGPPFTVTVLPIGIAGQDYLVDLGDYDPQAARLRIADIQPLNKAASDLLRAKRALLAQASAGSVDAFIAEQTRVEIGLPTLSDWSDAVLSCLSAGIDNLDFIDATGPQIIKALAKDSPAALKDAYEAAALGNPLDASLIISELGFKGLAIYAKNKNQLGAFLNALAEKGDYGKALAKGAGACTVDYKQAGAVVLEGLARAAFPLSSCGVDLMLQSAKDLRGLVTDALARKVYDKYRQGNDPLVDWSLNGYGYPLVVQYARKKGIDTAHAEAELNRIFSTWKLRESESGPLHDRLVQLKATWAQDKIWLEAGIRKSLPLNATDADAFAAYVAKMNTTRARLTAFNDTQQNLDVRAGLILRGAYLHGSTSVPFDVKAWKQGVAAALQTGAPNLFKSEPAVCGVEPSTARAWVLVETKDFNPTPYNNGGYVTTIGYARGNVTMGWSNGANTFDFRSSWSNPPNIIRAGDRIAMNMSIAVTANTGRDFFINGAFGVRFDAANIEPGYIQSPVEFTNEQGQTGYLEVSRGGDPAGTTISRSLSLSASSLRTGSDGARIAMIAYVQGFQNMAGTRYTYEWKVVD
ncbi:MAG: hypothetical protein IPH51_07410 [Rubrivivax sp.]|nr:hypothetical protein [Rubrivivax sp.]